MGLPDSEGGIPLAEFEENVDEQMKDKGEERPLEETASMEVTEIPATTLVEVSPGIAVLFGEVPIGLGLLDLPPMPESDRSSLNDLLSGAGTFATVYGNLGLQAQMAKGVYRLADQSQWLLDQGAALAAKDGAKIGSIFMQGDLIGQARFIPLDPKGMSSIMASAGPALQMIAIQQKLAEIEDLIATNIALTKQTLKTIRDEQWSELEAVVKTIHGAFAEATQIGTITDSIWEQVSPHGVVLNKQLSLYRKNVFEHVKQIAALEGRERREYLEREAEILVFDAHAILNSLKAHAEFQMLRAAQVRKRMDEDEGERELFELITRETPLQLGEAFGETEDLILQLTRELRIISELPGRATMPLTKKRRDKKATALTCEQLLDAVAPLADLLRPKTPELAEPPLLCAPENVDLAPYLKVLRWYMKAGESVSALAFAYSPKKWDAAGVVPGLLARRVDATWDSLDQTFGDGVLKKAAPTTLAAVTNRRVIVADADDLVRHGDLSADLPLESILLVRKKDAVGSAGRKTIDLITDDSDIPLLFPKASDDVDVDAFAKSIEDGISSAASVEAEAAKPELTSS